MVKIGEHMIERKPNLVLVGSPVGMSGYFYELYCSKSLDFMITSVNNDVYCSKSLDFMIIGDKIMKCFDYEPPILKKKINFKPTIFDRLNQSKNDRYKT
jgi:hypothetical protein